MKGGASEREVVTSIYEIRINDRGLIMSNIGFMEKTRGLIIYIKGPAKLLFQKKFDQ